MPREAPTLREVTSGVREPQVVFAPPTDTGGTLTVAPAFGEMFPRFGLHCAAAFLELPGEVVSGHADRHVMRVELPGVPHAFYLKRQHVVGWREKLRNRLAGFGWSSRCEREAEVLKQLEACGLPAPRWAACGTHGNRAFLLVEEVPGAVDLRRVLSDNALSLTQRRVLAMQLGRAVAAVHAAGFRTPDLTAKHVLVDSQTLAVTFLDWQSATRGASVSDSSRVNALGALHASLADALASPAERMLMLWAYLSASRGFHPHGVLPFATAGLNPAARRGFIASILRAAKHHAKRRSIRDQLQPEANAQRLVWLAGEAVCAIPEVAAEWTGPALGPPFYGFGADGVSQVRFANRDAILIRGRTSAPLGRFRAWLRATPWRSPGVTVGRVLFHLQRYGVPAPQLLAFGQRLLDSTRAEWFALHETPTGVLLRKWRRTATSAERQTIFDSVQECLRSLHDAGCVLIEPKAAFAVCDGRASIADPRAVRIVRRVSASARRRDLRDMARLLGVE